MKCTPGSYKCFPFFLLLIIPVFVWAQQNKPKPEDFVTGGWARFGSSDCVELTPAENWAGGSIWHKKAIDLSAPFEMEVELMLGCKDINGADGIVFVFHPNFNQLGYMGEGMGFAGLRPSLGIEIDTWENEHLADPAYDHIALLKNGNMSHFSNLTKPIRLPNVEDCDRHKLKVNWMPSVNKLNIQLDGKTYVSYKGNIVKEIFKGNTKVYWGVTAATGAFNNRHALCFEKLVYKEGASATETFSSAEKKELLDGEIVPLKNLQFATGSAQILSPSYEELDKLYLLLAENPGLYLELFGHTDSVGGANANKSLSQQRAEAVANYLMKKGINKKRLFPVGHGEAYPIASNNTAEGRRLNRRVELHFFKPIP